MKLFRFPVLALIVLLASAGLFAAQSTGFHVEPGADRAVVASGGSLDVESGGEIDVESGGSWKLAGTAVTASAAQLNLTSASPGRAFFSICGDATTINNNTVYYGPDVALVANVVGGMTCDINAAGNTTEATADAPVFTNQAFNVMGMWCRNEGDANADISFTLRTAAGATTPSVTCTIADGERDCVADVQTTTAIAAGATVAVAAASSGDIADANGFNCTVQAAY